MKAHARPAKPVELRDDSGASMLQRFEAFARALFAVPKKELDEKLAQRATRKRKPRKSS